MTDKVFNWIMYGAIMFVLGMLAMIKLSEVINN